MAIQIFDKQFNNYDENLNFPMEKIFVEKPTASGEVAYVSINKLFVKDGIKYRPVKNYADFKESARNNVLSYSGLNFVPAKHSAVVKNIDVPKYHESITMSTNQSPAGYKKYLQTVESSTFKKDEHIMVFVSNAKKPTFLKLNGMFYYDGATKKRLSIPAGSTLKEVLKDKDIFTTRGHLITAIYTEKTFNFKPCTYTKTQADGTTLTVEASESFNPNTMEKVSYSVKLNAEGIPTFEEQIVKVNSKIITHEPSTMTEDAGKNNGETQTVSAIKIKEFNMSTSEDAKFVRVVLENGALPKVVSVDDLYKDHKTKVDNLQNCVGKSVLVKIDNEFYVTNPLTVDQVSIRYEVKKFYNESKSKEDILADYSYLLMQDGTYHKEAEVAKPMYFKFVTSGDFDAYIAIVKDASGNERQIIIDKEHYEELNKNKVASSFVMNGYTIDITKVHKAKRTSSFANCDAVQTTSMGGKVDFCKIYSAEQKTKEEQQVQQEAFETAYKQGNYKLKGVYVKNAAGDEVLAEIDDRRERFIYEDVTYVKNHADYKNEYVALNEQGFKYESVDGELGKITGGPQYNIGKAISSSYKQLGKIVGTGFIKSLSPAGILATIALFPVVAVGIAAAAVSPIAIPVYHTVKGVYKNSFGKYKWADQNKFNEKIWQKEFEVAVQEICNQTNSNKNRSETKFINACNNIDQIANRLHAANVYAGFEMVDGTININSSNINAVGKFMKEAKTENRMLKNGTMSLLEKAKLNRVINKLSTKDKLTAQEEIELEQAKQSLDNLQACKDYLKLCKIKPEKLTEEQKQYLQVVRAKYENLSANFKNKMTNYKNDGYETAPSKKSAELLSNAETVKAFMYVKYFMKEDVKVNVNGEEISIADVKETLKDLNFDFAKNQFAHRRVKYSYDKLQEKNATIEDKIDISAVDEVISNLKTIKAIMESDYVKNIVSPKQSALSHKPIAPQYPTEELDDAATELETPKKTRTRLNKVVITSENAVAQQLEDIESKYYKDAIRNLTRKNGKFKMSEEEAVTTIFNFADKINQAHAENKHAKDVFEQGSIEAYLLTNITKSMSKAATLAYLPKEEKETLEVQVLQQK